MEVIEPLFFHDGQRAESFVPEEPPVESDEESEVAPVVVSTGMRIDREPSRPPPEKPPPVLLPELRRLSRKKKVKQKADEKSAEMIGDARMLEARGVMNPKRFYKKTDRISDKAQLGTVIAGPFDRHSLKRKQRRPTLAAEFLADADVRAYAKRRYAELQADSYRTPRVATTKRRRRPDVRKRK